ncbi:hypothetical protein ACH4T9_31090 [Micromonospora sp. NPDC020750]|uniref:hypothetical protein n=1 Tax=unclassified Micromonospora TaxID=2617518 RepID=UPI0037A44A75
MQTTAPAPTKAEQAINAALVAGFEITRHLPNPRAGTYHHELTHPDGRGLTIATSLGSGGRFIRAQGGAWRLWASTRMSVRSLPALQRLLDNGPA